MNDRELVRKSDDSADLLARIAVHFHTIDVQGATVLERIRDGYQGQPRAASYTGPTKVAKVYDPATFTDGENPDRDGHLPGDPTGEAAIRTDKANQDRRDIERAIVRIQKEALFVHRVLERYEPRAATDTDRARTEQENDPGCQSCSRIEGHNGPMWAPVYRHGTVNGNLAEAMHLCSWCYTYARNKGRLPVPRELEQHRDGIPVRTSA